MIKSVHTLTEKSPMGFISRLSWSAVFAGVFIAIAIQLLLSLLGLSIGFGSINPVEDAKPFSGLGTGALIWWIVTMLISLFAGGWVAGWFSNQVQKTDLILHGLITWCLLTFLNIYLVTSSVSKIVGGAGSVITKGLSMAGEGIKSVAPEAGDAIKDQLNIDGGSIEKMKKEAELLLKQTGKKDLQPEQLKNKAKKATGQAENTGKSVLENPQLAQQKLDSLVSKLFSTGDATFEAADRDALVNIVMNRTGKSKVESEQIVDNWISTIKTTKEKVKQAKDQAIEKAKEVGDDLASGLSKFAIFSFFGLLLGAVSASLGAGAAARKREAVIVHTVD
ncbi:ElaB/YqjD/DUF883 family membrane-anchored ribosome-binding protein [Pedobacter cryoconitis]|uniref:ElaB/YqjD/DUF883 family membrane-anchored ribosome-binding protein n=1 Tax=Pedobacter cryoconitis TaxID=188932 RepID=A0A7W8YWV2_9SPHI|nr:hypothetical protein [Pedobacter cryoconitis]MBB5623296.1 ElaB/YqjD/DUF883 family membrane-anchored ribosome-binding protein [Pedobacter cryoconitis]